MSDLRELVQRNHNRLKNEYEGAVGRGAIVRSKQPFHEHFSGKVLLGPDETRKVERGLLRGADGGVLVAAVYDELLEAGEGRFLPALTFDKDRRLIVIVIIIKP